MSVAPSGVSSSPASRRPGGASAASRSTRTRSPCAGSPLRVHVQETFPFERVADAHRLLEGGHLRGKVVLTV